MILHSRLIYIGLFFVLLFSACSKDEKEVAAPILSDVEIGSGNNKIGYAGGDIHIEAEIAAPGKIASVTVSIHPEAGAGWEFDSTYIDGFAGLLNAEFHKHIHIPVEAATGKYHLRFSVLDQNGKKKDIEAEITIVLNPDLPNISDLEVTLSGEELHVEGTITAPKKIAKVEVEIHGSSWEKDFEYTDAAMVGETNYSFHKHINIAAAPAGHYHVHVKVEDQDGNEREFEGHFDKP